MAQDPAAGEPTTLRRRGALGVATVLALAVLAVYAADASLPPNALELPGQQPSVFRALLPEGWAFFTRNPREQDMQPWLRDDAGRWVDAQVGANAAPAQLFGASRRPRARLRETGLIYAEAVRQKAAWVDCAAPVPECLAHAPVAATVRNGTPGAALCGQVAVSRQAPLPWAWASEGVREPMPVQVIRVAVTC